MTTALLTMGVTTVQADDKGHAGATDGYQLVWSDEFDGTALDETLWNIEVNGNGGGNNELQYYRRENVSVANGNLILTARREEYNGKHFTSGRLNSQGKVYFKHGKIESRIKLPKTANGLWPAFWMMGNDIYSSGQGWPRCGEIDILEMGNSNGIKNGTQERYFNGACHWGFYRDGAYPNYAKSSTWSYSLQDDDYHLFTMVWNEQELRMYVDLDRYPDSAPYYNIGIEPEAIDNDWATGLYFHKNFFILYDLAVGGNFPGIWNADGITAVPAGTEKSMYIDWVRVYQKDDVNINYPGHPGTASDVNDYSYTPEPAEPEKASIAPAPDPTKAESEVVSLYSDRYINNHNFEYAVWWDQQATWSEAISDNNKMWHIRKFQFTGSNHDKMDLSQMEGLHLDVYPVDKDFDLSVKPINRSADNTANEGEAYVCVHVQANQWNQINIPISDFLNQGLPMQRVYQLMLQGKDGGNGDGNTEFYLDNIYYYKGSTPTAIQSASVANNRTTNTDSPIYNLQGQRVGKDYKGIVIKNGKKVLQ